MALRYTCSNLWCSRSHHVGFRSSHPHGPYGSEVGYIGICVICGRPRFVYIIDASEHYTLKETPCVCVCVCVYSVADPPTQLASTFQGCPSEATSVYISAWSVDYAVYRRVYIFSSLFEGTAPYTSVRAAVLSSAIIYTYVSYIEMA